MALLEHPLDNIRLVVILRCCVFQVACLCGDFKLFSFRLGVIACNLRCLSSLTLVSLQVITEKSNAKKTRLSSGALIM